MTPEELERLERLRGRVGTAADFNPVTVEWLLDLVDRLRGERDRAMADACEMCRAYAEEHDRQCRANQETLEKAEAEVTRLKALVDAATMFRFGRVRVVQFGAGHWSVERLSASSAWKCDRSYSFLERDKALNEARDLAAKETER